MREIIFEVTEAPEGGYNARALGHSVFTQGEDWDDLKEMVREAVICHFNDREVPCVIRCASCGKKPSLYGIAADLTGRDLASRSCGCRAIVIVHYDG